MAMPSDATERTEPPVDSTAGATDRSAPTWVWIVLGVLGTALVAVTLALFLEARDTSEQAAAGAESSAQLLDALVAEVETVNDELAAFNAQFAAASASAQAKAQDKKSQKSSSNDQSP